ncbi:MAG: TIGR02391 family protein [Desulfamplus sp.]|nr:TIGR02391 family protein [Desulfamplus sp.]
MDKIEPFNAQILEAACKVLADTERGLTGSQIGYIIQECKINDTDPTNTKWKRLFNALAEAQNKYQVGNHLIMFVNRSLNPVSYARDKEAFEWLRSELNVVLSFSGYQVREDGKVITTKKETTLRGAIERAGALRAKLEDRNAHQEVFDYCREELLDQNYFHAVFESIKGLAQRIREMSGLPTDGAELVNTAFSVKKPILKINSLNTETEISEQKGFSNILVGLFGSVRNPVAHAPKTSWPMTERDALDIFSMVSFIHRKLDNTKKI